MSPGSIYAHKGITIKRQNGVLSAVFDRVWRDGVGVEGGKKEGTELYTWTQSQEALVIVFTLPLAHTCGHNNHSVSWNKRQTKKWFPKRILAWNTSHVNLLLKELYQDATIFKESWHYCHNPKINSQQALKAVPGMRSAWFACPSLLTKFWFSKILFCCEGRFLKVLQLQFFFIMILYLIYKGI